MKMVWLWKTLARISQTRTTSIRCSRTFFETAANNGRLDEVDNTEADSEAEHQSNGHRRVLRIDDAVYRDTCREDEAGVRGEVAQQVEQHPEEVVDVEGVSRHDCIDDQLSQICFKTLSGT